MSRKWIAMLLIAVMLLAGCSSTKPEPEKPSSEAQTLSFNGFLFPTGDLDSGLKVADAREMSEEEAAEADRAMRAYTPGPESYLKNKAKTFVYYETLDKDEQALYDAMLMAAEDPTDPNNIVICTTDLDPSTPEFRKQMQTAYFCMLYDHPELFWLYNDINASMGVGSRENNGRYDVYFGFSEQFEEFPEVMTRFNDAVDAFLADIDLTKSEKEIAIAIHDKLIDTVTYDMKVCNENIRSDYAHTAYGPLVENGRGQANTAVCDGYSLAYTYLLQQAGLTAAVIVGEAGGDKETMGGHAWNIIMIDGVWHEVDSTWDDMGTLEDQLAEYKGEEVYDYYMEALNDAAYRDSIEHYLYLISTDDLREYDPGDSYTYYSKDGKYMYSLVGQGVHYRVSELTGWEPYSYVIERAPIAE